jgi:murein L,D-transpeptidase YafK
MHMFRIMLLVIAGLFLTACGSQVAPYTGPSVTLIEVHKAERKMYMLHEDKVVKSYDISLGRSPIGHKQFEGDMRTPEGMYSISLKNPRSTYHKSLQVSYPNQADRANAAAMGRPPGGDIFIHGGPLNRPAKPQKKRLLPLSLKQKEKPVDWTAGCIAVTDAEIDEIYAMIETRTPIRILP